MIVTQPLPNPCETHITQTTGPGDIPERIRMLAVQGLKVCDISSLLHIHPLIVMRVLSKANVIGGLRPASNGSSVNDVLMICDS